MNFFALSRRLRKSQVDGSIEQAVKIAVDWKLQSKAQFGQITFEDLRKLPMNFWEQVLAISIKEDPANVPKNLTAKQLRSPTNAAMKANPDFYGKAEQIVLKIIDAVERDPSLVKAFPPKAAKKSQPIPKSFGGFRRLLARVIGKDMPALVQILNDVDYEAGHIIQEAYNLWDNIQAEMRLYMEGDFYYNSSGMIHDFIIDAVDRNGAMEYAHYIHSMPDYVTNKIKGLPAIWGTPDPVSLAANVAERWKELE